MIESRKERLDINSKSHAAATSTTTTKDGVVKSSIALEPR